MSKDWKPVLQWGRGLKTPEKWMAAEFRSPAARCFNGAGVLRPRKTGNNAVNRSSVTKLQWGRGLKTPEKPSTVALLNCPEGLQWGRGLKTPENRWGIGLSDGFVASMGPGS